MFLLLACIENEVTPPEEEVVEGSRLLDVSPDALPFGVLPSGSSESAVVTLRSLGTAAVTISELELRGSRTFEITPLADPVIEPGEEVEVVVTYTATGPADEAELVVHSDSTTPRVPVELSGAANLAMLSVDPPSLEFTSLMGESVTHTLTLTSVGSLPITVTAQTLSGEYFDLPVIVPITLEPGESTEVEVTYGPPGVDREDEGMIWYLDDGVSQQTAVTLHGTVASPCLGLAQAWEEGKLHAQHTMMGDFVLKNTSSDEDICMDRWYLFFTETSQDLGAGDHGYDPGGEYPRGTITLEAGDSLSFPYGAEDGDAWFCVEETQVTAPTDSFFFYGMRVPDILLQDMLAADQEAVWATEATEPVFAVGREKNSVALSRGHMEDVELKVVNLGREDGQVHVVETIPDGFSASDFSVAPTKVQDTPDGTAYHFDLEINAAVDTPIDVHTIYDWTSIRYTLKRVDECEGPALAGTPVASWTDPRGDTQVAEGSPMMTMCAEE